jgi:hypothetical protein
MTPRNILETGFDKQIAEAVVTAYTAIEQNFILQKWKPSEFDAGHFVEAVRRALDLELTGVYVPFGSPLPQFDDKTLKHYEQQSGHESYRLLIPRVLKAIYNIRNKRGVAHISDINPNEMDASLILHCAKWVLAELVRLKSGLSPAATQELIDTIIERHCPLIWSVSGVTCILDPKMTARDQILVLLYDRSPISDVELQRTIEYKNTSAFKKILRRLHSDRLIYYFRDGNCEITTRGVSDAEKIIKQRK